MNRPLFRTLALTVILALASSAAQADSLSQKSGKAFLDFKNVTIKSVKDGQLYFQNQSGNETHKELEDIFKVNATGETAFNQAEVDYFDAVSATGAAATKKYADAVKNYQSAAQSSQKQWVKDLANYRLKIAAPKSGRFDLAVDAWAMAVPKEPAAAMKSKPSLEGIDPKSTYVADAIKKMQALVAWTNKPEEKSAYLDMIVDLQKHIGDAEAASKTMGERVRIAGNPSEVAEYESSLAMLDHSKKNLDAAAAKLATIKFDDLPDAARGDYLFLSADIKSSKTPPTSAPEALKDLALDYMRLVANYPTSAQAGPALLKVAELHEAFKDNDTALKIYLQVAKEQANTPAGQAAQKSADRLGKSSASN